MTLNLMTPNLLMRVRAARAAIKDAAHAQLADVFDEAIACVQQGLSEAEDVAEAALAALAQRVDQIKALQHQVAAAQQERDSLLALVNNPHNAEFLEGVRREVAHQVNRWGTVHDRAKAPEDWLWLLGHLVGKALHHHKEVDRLNAELQSEEGSPGREVVATLLDHHTEKALHHCISSAAVLANWHTHILLGRGAMVPGSSDLQRFLTETFGAEVPQ